MSGHAPGDHVQIVGDVDSNQQVQALWAGTAGAWHHSAYVAVGTPCIILATTQALFSDSQPGHLVMVGGEFPVFGWIRAERVGELTDERDDDAEQPTRMSRVPAGATICTRCEQWTSYGSSCIGPCVGSTWTEVGRRDPLHDWVHLADEKEVSR